MRNRKVKVINTVQFNRVFGIENQEVRQPSLVDSFAHETREDAETGKETYTFHHPLYMLFNQQRIDRLGDEAIRMWLKQLDAAGNSARERIKKQVSDDDLLKMIKPRNIQSPSELESWLAYINERADVFNEEVAKIVAEEKEKQDQLLEQQQSAQQQEITPSTV